MTYKPFEAYCDSCAVSELRTTCSNKVLNASIKLGGLGKTVEIDESKFGAKRKYKRGRVESLRRSVGVWSSGARITESAALPCS